MIQGVVNARREAVVRLKVRGPAGLESDVDAIVDSGFTASLTLPATMVAAEATIDQPNKNLCRDVCATRVRRVIEGYGGTPGLGGDFAYLRCRRIAPGKLLEIDHSQVWTALQLTHCPRLTPNAEQPVLTAGDEEQLLVYVPRYRAAHRKILRQALKTCRAAIVYSWQPELMRDLLKDFEHVQVEAAPDSLARRFGMRI